MRSWATLQYMQKSHFLTLAILIGVLFVAATITYVVYIWPEGEEESDAGKTLISSETQVFTDLNGNPFTFDDFVGKIRVVNSWASWTPFSAQELRELEELARAFDQEQVVFVAVNRKESKEIAKSFLATLGDLKHVHFAIDVHDTFYASVGGYAMPETVIYDASGTIVFHKRGPVTKKEIEERVAEALLDSR